MTCVKSFMLLLVLTCNFHVGRLQTTAEVTTTQAAESTTLTTQTSTVVNQTTTVPTTNTATTPS
uniref:Uncharacterized protein n=1 Tax=Ciona savignyi TaxID=51511 RepID=H2ZQX1_CIOSA